jgi:ribose transport system substrate-binding protein
VIAGCGDDTKDEEVPRGDPLTFAWIPKDNNVIFETGAEGARLRAQELSEDTKVNRDINVLFPVDVLQPATMIPQAITDGAQGIAISPANATTQTQPINDAMALETPVPVMTWDSDAPLSTRFTNYSVDNLASGKLAADLLFAALPNGANTVAFLSGAADANLEARLNGFRDRVAELYSPAKNATKNITIVSTVLRCTGSQLAQCSGFFEQFVIDNPGIDGWFFAAVWKRVLVDEQSKPENANTVLMPTWRTNSKSGVYKTVAFDALKVAVPYLDASRTTTNISEGLVSALIAQKYWGWGYDSIDILYKKVADGEEFGTFVDSGFDVVCPNNQAQMAAAWASNNFSTSLAKCTLLP